MLLLFAVLAFLAISIAFMLHRAFASPEALPVTTSWIEDLSPERYRPMLRLLDENDVRFLQTQPGYNSRTVSRLRAQRCAIFRGYLKALQTDFRRTCGALKLVMIQSQ